MEVYYNSSTINRAKLLVCQKRIVRVMYGVDSRTHTNSLFASSGLLKLPELNRYQTLIYMYKALFCGGDETLRALRRNRDNHSYGTRNGCKLIVPRFSRTKSKQSLVYVAAQYWNDLPVNVDDCHNLGSFKRQLKFSLLKMYESS